MILPLSLGVQTLPNCAYLQPSLIPVPYQSPVSIVHNGLGYCLLLHLSEPSANNSLLLYSFSLTLFALAVAVAQSTETEFLSCVSLTMTLHSLRRI